MKNRIQKIIFPGFIMVLLSIGLMSCGENQASPASGAGTIKADAGLTTNMPADLTSGSSPENVVHWFFDDWNRGGDRAVLNFLSPNLASEIQSGTMLEELLGVKNEVPVVEAKVISNNGKDAVISAKINGKTGTSEATLNLSQIEGRGWTISKIISGQPQITK